MFKVLKECFSSNLNDYDNIGINREINKVILGAVIALIVGVIFLNVYRGNIKLVVTQLTRHKSKSEEDAKTLTELGLDNNRITKWMLSRENLLTKIVGRKGEKKYGYEEYKALTKKERIEAEKFDINTAEFYIREEQRDLAKGAMERYGTSIMHTTMTCVFIAIISVCVIASMPEILDIINNLLRSK
jgi:hypothetical protein